jgi:glycosyltransferase involved in cell wall biosynthesis
MISIITPCFNSEKTIRNTIESVVNQTYRDIEYIIVDGKSSDGTLNIIKEYSEKYDFIKYISEKDNSMTEALNKGFKMGTGEFICSINADDCYELDAIEKVINAFMINKCDVVVGNTKFVKNEKVIANTLPKFMCNEFLFNILDCSAPECSMFFRNEVIVKENYFDETYKYTQDYELYLRLMRKGYKFYYLNEFLSKFYISDDQYSTKLYDLMIEEACSYNKYPTMFKLLKKTKVNSLIKYACRWAKR